VYELEERFDCGVESFVLHVVESDEKPPHSINGACDTFECVLRNMRHYFALDDKGFIHFMQIDDLIVVLQKIYDEALILSDDALRALNVAKELKAHPPAKKTSAQSGQDEIGRKTDWAG